jgi:aldehyde dehydrogenase (NAD+)
MKGEPVTATETNTNASDTGEVRMLVDGELVEARSGRRFDNVNPATEVVLGPVADADADDMGERSPWPDASGPGPSA